MSKSKDGYVEVEDIFEDEVPMYDHIPGIVIERDAQLSQLVGILMMNIEATFTDLEQRKAQKRLVKNQLYDWYYNIYDDQHLEPNLRGMPLDPRTVFNNQ